jgi:ABC-type sugar transport system permease subunit
MELVMTTLIIVSVWLGASYPLALLVGAILDCPDHYESGEQRPMTPWQARHGDGEEWRK